jgi:hypothetical protein
MKHHPHDDLLKETFSDGELDALREASLHHGLDTLRTRRRLCTLRASTLIATPALLLLAILFWRAPSTPLPITETQTSAAIPSLKIYPAVNAANVAPVPTISDQELLALYANRSVGLLGKPGQQKLVFFDKLAASVN